MLATDARLQTCKKGVYRDCVSAAEVFVKSLLLGESQFTARCRRSLCLETALSVKARDFVPRTTASKMETNSNTGVLNGLHVQRRPATLTTTSQPSGASSHRPKTHTCASHRTT